MSDQAKWQAEINARIAKGDGLEFDPASFAAANGSAWPNDALQTFLDQLVQSEELNSFTAQNCPECELPLDAGMISSGECPQCHLELSEDGDKPVASTRYRLAGGPSRDIRWVVVAHGMNTRGVWQEALSWLVANKLKYAAPVLIHKYGWATIDVVVAFRHRGLSRQLGTQMRRANHYARKSGTDAPPDIIVHSFGTLLLSLLLMDPDFKELRFGRIITTGCIIRPDFNWQAMIDEGRIEAVLNHIGGKDIWPGVAQFLIPNTGPSGRAGFVDTVVYNQLSPDFGHSDCLTEEHLDTALAKGGLWDLFLTSPAGQFTPTQTRSLAKWRPAFGPFRWLAHALGFLLFLIVLPFSAIRRKIDP